MLLRQFGHGELYVKAVVSYIAILGAEFGVFQTVAAHLGVLVVDRVDDGEDDADAHYCEGHQSCYDGQVVLYNKRDKTKCQSMNGAKIQLTVSISVTTLTFSQLFILKIVLGFYQWIRKDATVLPLGRGANEGYENLLTCSDKI